MDKTRILIADDPPLFREGLLALPGSIHEKSWARRERCGVGRVRRLDFVGLVVRLYGHTGQGL